jgi:hypothetical protein
MKRIIKHELVEVLIPAGSSLTKFAFPEIGNLRNARIYGMQFHDGTITPISLLSLRPVTEFDINKFAYLTLANYGGKNFLDKAPVRIFQTMSSATSVQGSYETDVKNFTGQGVNWTKSYIEVSASIAALALVDTVFLFSVYYIDPADTTNTNTFQQRK